LLLTTKTLLEIVTLLPPLKYIRSLRSVKLPKLSVPSPAKPAPIADVVPVSTPTIMMEQIGAHLAYWRNQQSLSVEEVAALTQIQPRLIQAIEEGHIEMLPESVYVKGMIRRYGDCLGMDGNGLAEYVPSWQRDVTPFKQKTSTRNETFSQPKIEPIHWYLIYALTILGGSAGLSHILNNAAKPTYPIVENTKPPAVTPVEIDPPAPVESPETVQVRINVKNPIWAEIVVDGNPKIVGNLKTGEQRDWIVTQQMTIRTNDGGGLFVSRGQQPFQALGQPGQKKQVTIKVEKKPTPKVKDSEVENIDP
jgi:Helix-turn-helix domain/Domain of unknown function (DUF4115)